MPSGKGGKMSGIKILLAEDYKGSQIITMRLLKQNGFEEVEIAENGEEAIKLAKEKKFDLILMDTQMPIMSGLEAIEKIRLMRRYRRIPIIALSAFATKGDRRQCAEIGATDLVAKPINAKELIEKMMRYTN